MPRAAIIWDTVSISATAPEVFPRGREGSRSGGQIDDRPAAYEAPDLVRDLDPAEQFGLGRAWDIPQSRQGLAWGGQAAGLDGPRGRGPAGAQGRTIV